MSLDEENVVLQRNIEQGCILSVLMMLTALPLTNGASTTIV